ncbi:MAG TPA: 4-hydroxy-tetrahydrodipicolinate synthase [Spirochaetia bacterium]|nr:4-hydroxy-tetrahydrodipicolinate synthase [Spirochaetia bacterium]
MFQGVYPAIITPFKKDESLDEKALRNLIRHLIKEGITGIVPCGTTGESPTLDYDEHMRVIEITVEEADGRIPVIAGTGSNSTREAVLLSKKAAKIGADALLLVSPYYNKPTQEGLYRHFCTVAKAVDLPVIIYNIKSRTGVNVETKTLFRIAAECPNIAGVKEASGDMEQIKDVIKNAPDGFSVLSGDDSLTLELMKNGGHGVISVAANLIPGQMVRLVKTAAEKDFPSAKKLHDILSELFSALFIETNPIPVKAALADRGMCEEIYRLPMCPMQKENREYLLQTVKKIFSI